MEQRYLGRSGLRVPVLSLGTATFGGEGKFFEAWGTTQVDEARRMVDLCLEHGLNLFDTANIYSAGVAESILGETLRGRRQKVLVSTKATFPMGAQEYGSSRAHLTQALDDSLRRLQTDYVDIYHMHGQDLLTPPEETLRTLDDFVRSGKVRYIACSNFSGWHLSKSLALSERYGWARYVGHQVYYSLVGRELEWELMPLALDQGVGSIVWSPLAGGALTGKIRRDKPAPANSRLGSMDFIPFNNELLHRVVDAMDEVAQETQKTLAQIALNWLLQRPSVATVVVGARNETQLQQNLGAVGWSLTPAQMAKLDAASDVAPVYPYWHQKQFPQLMPPVIPPHGSAAPGGTR